MNNTKENILLSALKLFARDGYEAVSVNAIAGDIGITKGALYKHYKNKQDIFDTIITRMEQRDAEQAEAFSLPCDNIANMEKKYRLVTIDSLIDYSKAQFRYWTEDAFASNFRKMLTLEQYRSSKMNALYQQYIVSGPLGYVTDIFRSIGIENPEESAAELYSPMFLLYSVYDGAENKEYASALADRCLENLSIRIKDVKK